MAGQESLTENNLTALGWQGDELVRSWVGAVAPSLADKTASFVFGEVYALQQLPSRYREVLIACVVAATGSFPEGAVQHLQLALKEGLAPQELDEAFTLLAAYAGFPCAIAAARELQARLQQTEAAGSATA